MTLDSLLPECRMSDLSRPLSLPSGLIDAASRNVVLGLLYLLLLTLLVECAGASDIFFEESCTKNDFKTFGAASSIFCTKSSQHHAQEVKQWMVLTGSN